MNTFFAHHTYPRPLEFHELEKGWLPRESRFESEIKEMVGAPKEAHFLLAEDRAAANFCALFSTYADFIRENGRTHLLAPFGEHPSIVQGIHRLENFEIQGKFLPLNSQGQITKQVVEEHLRPRSAMLSISWAHDLTGVVQPIHEIYEACQAKEVRLHVDITHAIGKLFLHGGFDLLTFDGAFLGAPRGTGVLISQEKMTPNAFGGAPPVPALLTALAEGTARAIDQMDQMALEVGPLRDQLERGLQEAIPECQPFFTEVERLPNVAVIAFPGVHAELLECALQRAGVWVTHGEGRLAEILKACGFEAMVAHSALSFALSTLTTKEEVEKGVALISEVVAALRPISEGVLCS